MAELVDIVCPTCGFRWQEDLDWHRENESIHLFSRPGEGRREQFRFRCPQDGTWVSYPSEAGTVKDASK